jgi:hypothetical protein
MAANNNIFKMSNAGGFKSLNRYYDMLAGNTVWNPWEPAGAYESIATVTVGSGGSSSIDFTSIPSTYKHLQIRGMYLANNTDFSSVFRLNASSTANDYSAHTLVGDGSTADAQNDNSTNPSSMRIFYSGDITSYPSVFVLDILDYADTNKNTTCRVIAGSDSNNIEYRGKVVLSSSAWYQTNAVNQVTIYSATGAFGGTLGSSFKQYSSFALYGIRGN